MAMGVSLQRITKSESQKNSQKSAYIALKRGCRLEENVLVTADGPVVFAMMEHMEEAMR